MISFFYYISLFFFVLTIASSSLFSQTKSISKTPVEKSKKQLLEDEINDLQSKKDNLQKELDELNKVEVKEPEVNSPDKTKPETKEENFFKLESEIVSSLASRRSQSIDSAPGIITVYSDKQIEQLGFQNLGDLIRTIPGMNIDYRPTEIGLIRSRGVPQSILILLDGIPMMQKNVARGIWEFPLSIGSIKRVEVMRGPGSVIWGANAFMGIINIVTKNADSVIKSGKNSGYNVMTRIGSWDTKKFYFNTATRLTDNVSLYLGGAYENTLGYTQDWRATTTLTGFGVYQEPGANLINERNTNYINNTPTQNQSYEQIYQPWVREYGGTKDRRNPSTLGEISVKLNITPYENGSIEIGYLTNRNRHYYVIGTSGAQSGRYGNPYYEQPFDVYNAIFTHKFTKDLNFKLNLNRYESKELLQHLRSSASYSNTSFSNINDTRGNSRNLDSRYQIDGNYMEPLVSNVIDMQLNYSGLQRHNIILGSTFLEQNQPRLYTYRNYSSLNSRYIITKDRMTEWYDQGPNSSQIRSLYLQDDIKLLSNLTWQVGARYDKHYLTPSVANPKTSLVWKITETVIGKLLYGKGFREPGFNDLFSTLGSVGSVSFAGKNPDPTVTDPKAGVPEKLRPEKSESIETQILWTPIQGFRTGLNFSRSRLKDMIVSYYQENGWSWNRNKDNLKINAIEWELNYEIKSQKLFLLPGTYVYANTSYTDVRREVPAFEAEDTFKAYLKNPSSDTLAAIKTAGQTEKYRYSPALKMGNLGGSIRFLENWRSNFNLYYNSERTFRNVRVYPENDKEIYFLSLACGNDLSNNCQAYRDVNASKRYKTLPAYFTLDLGISFELPSTDERLFRISLQCNNVFNRMYNGLSSVIPNYQPGRNFFLTLSYSF